MDMTTAQCEFCETVFATTIKGLQEELARKEIVIENYRREANAVREAAILSAFADVGVHTPERIAWMERFEQFVVESIARQKEEELEDKQH